MLVMSRDHEERVIPLAVEQLVQELSVRVAEIRNLSVISHFPLPGTPNNRRGDWG